MSGFSAFFRFACLGVAVAVFMAVYGFNKFKPKNLDLTTVLIIGNVIYAMHSLALMTIPLTDHPVMAFWLLSAGMTIFSGSCYFGATTANQIVIKYSAIGCILLILGWLTVALH